MKTKNLLIGTLLGLTVGTVIGLLIAPKKGAVTRRFLAQKGSNYMDEVKEIFTEKMKVVNQKIDNLKDEVKSMINKGSAKNEEEFKRTTV